MKTLSTIVLVLLAAGCGGSAPSAPSPARAVRVEETRLRPVVAGRRYSGVLEPNARVTLTFRAQGRVASIAQAGGRALGAGDHVRRGQVLAVIDAAELKHQVAAADSGAAVASGELGAANAALAQAGREAARVGVLFEKRAVPGAELERATAALEGARARVAAAEAARTSRREQHALAKSALDEARLVSPMDGWIVQRTLEVGDVVAPGRPAFVIMDDRALRLGFAVPDSRVGSVQTGATVRVSAPALPGATFDGTVSRIEPLADPRLRTFAVEVVLANEGGLRAGMVATAELGESAREQLLVPLDAIVQPGEGNGFAVWLLDGEGRAQLRAVEIGDLSADDAIVTRGLAVGERLVVEGAAFLGEGEKVEVVQ